MKSGADADHSGGTVADFHGLACLGRERAQMVSADCQFDCRAKSMSQKRTCQTASGEKGMFFGAPSSQFY
jgi:hypothetical protein